jgi:flagellar biosynthetic protein FliR
MVKIGLPITFAIILVPMVSQLKLPVIDSIWVLGALAIKEMLVGFIIGLFFAILFNAVRMGGNIIGYQIGLLIAQVMDPEANSSVSLVGEFLYVLALLIFLAIDGHHAILSAFSDSYKVVPVGVFNFAGSAGEMLIKYTAYAFTIAIKLAAPVMITLFLTTVSLGVIARTVPQMNIFIVGLPLKIGIGFLVLAAALPVFRFMIEKMTCYFEGQIENILCSIGT